MKLSKAATVLTVNIWSKHHGSKSPMHCTCTTGQVDCVYANKMAAAVNTAANNRPKPAHIQQHQTHRAGL
jgi:hypothetical protein